VVLWFNPYWNSTNGPTNIALLIDVASTNSTSTNEWWLATCRCQSLIFALFELDIGPRGRGKGSVNGIAILTLKESLRFGIVPDMVIVIAMQRDVTASSLAVQAQ
jgi:hypothetical protein